MVQNKVRRFAVGLAVSWLAIFSTSFTGALNVDKAVVRLQFAHRANKQRTDSVEREKSEAFEAPKTQGSQCLNIERVRVVERADWLVGD